MPRTQPSFETEKRPFASRLTYIMREKRITQKQLGEAIGKRPQTVSLYQLGQSEPDAETILKIAEYLDVTIDWLCGREGAPVYYGSTVSEAAAVLGLSETAAEKVSKYAGYFNAITRQPSFEDFINEFIGFCSLVEGGFLDMPMPDKLPNRFTYDARTGGIIISRPDAIAAQRYHVSHTFDNVMEDIFQKREEDVAKSKER